MTGLCQPADGDAIKYSWVGFAAKPADLLNLLTCLYQDFFATGDAVSPILLALVVEDWQIELFP